MGQILSSPLGPINKRASLVAKCDIFGNAILIRSSASGFLHKLLRPEFVKENPTPLSSDAFTGFQSPDDPNKQIHAQEVKEATRLLFKKVGSFATELNRHDCSPVDHQELIEEMHKRGINARYLGMLRTMVRIEHLQSFILTEMCVRVFKNQLREIMRNNTDTADESYRNIGLAYFNKVLGKSPESDLYWNESLKILVQVKFPLALKDDERAVSYDLRDHFILFPLFTRFFFR